MPIWLLADRADDGAALVSPNVTIGSPNDGAALDTFAACCDVLTFDHEIVPFEHLEQLERAGHTLYPPASTIALAQNKRIDRGVLNSQPLRPQDDDAIVGRWPSSGHLRVERSS